MPPGLAPAISQLREEAYCITGPVVVEDEIQQVARTVPVDML